MLSCDLLELTAGMVDNGLAGQVHINTVKRYIVIGRDHLAIVLRHDLLTDRAYNKMLLVHVEERCLFPATVALKLVERNLTPPIKKPTSGFPHPSAFKKLSVIWLSTAHFSFTFPHLGHLMLALSCPFLFE